MVPRHSIAIVETQIERALPYMVRKPFGQCCVKIKKRARIMQGLNFCARHPKSAWPLTLATLKYRLGILK